MCSIRSAPDSSGMPQTWHLLWCDEEAHKPHNLERRENLVAHASKLNWTFSSFKKAEKAAPWVAKQSTPVVVLLNWREVKPFMKLLFKEADGNRPVAAIIHCVTPVNVRNASKWLYRGSNMNIPMSACNNFIDFEECLIKASQAIQVPQVPTVATTLIQVPQVPTAATTLRKIAQGSCSNCESEDETMTNICSNSEHFQGSTDVDTLTEVSEDCVCDSCSQIEATQFPDSASRIIIHEVFRTERNLNENIAEAIAADDWSPFSSSAQLQCGDIVKVCKSFLTVDSLQVALPINSCMAIARVDRDRNYHAFVPNLPEGLEHDHSPWYWIGARSAQYLLRSAVETLEGDSSESESSDTEEFED